MLIRMGLLIRIGALTGIETLIIKAHSKERGALSRKGVLIGRRALNQILTVTVEIKLRL